MQKLPKIRNLGTIAQLCRAISSQLRHVSTVGKSLLNSSTSPTSPYNMAEIVLLVWGTPANFKGFCVLASLLQQCRSMEVNQTLYDLWPCPMLVHCIYILGLCYPLTEFATCKIHFASNFCILRYWQRYCTALQQLASAAWYKEWNYGTFTESTAYIRLGGHHVGHWPTF